MKRFRLRFILLSIVVLVPLAFLVYRAVRSAEVEAQMQHQAIAERVFDEMERGLSRVLESEERRPTEGFLTAALEPSFQFVMGHFEIGPDGRIAVAAVPPVGMNRATRDLSAGSRSNTEGYLEGMLSTYWRTRQSPKEGRLASSQLPGTTLRVPLPSTIYYADGDIAAGAEGDGQEVSTLQALRSLNRGATERVDRPATKTMGETYSRDKAPVAADLSKTEAPRPEQPSPPSHQEGGAPEVETTPMGVRWLGQQRLLLVRTVVRASQAYRQGAVVDVDALARWLHDSSLGGNPLVTQARVLFFAEAPPTLTAVDALAARPEEHVYQHRFAEPFDDLSAVLSLENIAVGSNVKYAYILSALVLAAATLGLLAMYRMVAVIVSYAERRSNFVAAVSHELKTPLTAIRMYGEMLRDGIVPSEAKRAEYYRHITSESERLSRLIDNVLEFSRLEKGNRSINLVSASVVPAVREAADLLRPHVESCGFRLLVECDEQVPPVRFERDALVQVLCNLGDNAVKYAADSVRRQIELRCRQENGAVLLTVRDHGPGVSQRHLGKIFEPFYRGENELTRRTKGTGLGLALVRGLCERMEAEVSGRNVAGGGFEVEIRLRS